MEISREVMSIDCVDHRETPLLLHPEIQTEKRARLFPRAGVFCRRDRQNPSLTGENRLLPMAARSAERRRRYLAAEPRSARVDHRGGLPRQQSVRFRESDCNPRDGDPLQVCAFDLGALDFVDVKL